MDRKKQAEAIAEAFAADFLEETTGAAIFIGSHIERILASKAKVIYQYTEDPKYFGAAISHESGDQFIAINTFHPLRVRYFTAAHELWHLSEASQLQDEDFDHERAADRFAAAIMLPKAITKDLWLKFKKLYEPKEAIIHLADLSEAPHEAVVRRLKELGISLSGMNLSEDGWKSERKRLNLPESALDLSQRIERFVAYEHAVEEAIEEKSIDPLTASNKLAKYNTQLARTLQEQEVERIKEVKKNEA